MFDVVSLFETRPVDTCCHEFLEIYYSVIVEVAVVNDVFPVDVLTREVFAFGKTLELIF